MKLGFLQHNYTRIFSLGLLIFLSACEKDNSLLLDDQINQSVEFPGTWNRDSVIVNEKTGSNWVNLEKLVNNGTYLFNTDKKSGILTISGNQYAITWATNSNTITISEPDWLNQKYTVSSLAVGKVKLSGTATGEEGESLERILYLSKK